MTKKKAEQQGLSFTGIYERGYKRDEVKIQVAGIRKQYKCRAVLVDESCGGVSVYADEKYDAAKNLETALKNLGNIEARREAAKAAYEKTLEIINQDELRYLKQQETSIAIIKA